MQRLSLHSSKNVCDCLFHVPTVLTCGCVAGFDGFNNNNVDFGGSQLAADFDNKANQVNVKTPGSTTSQFKTPGSTTSQFNGEPCNNAV